MALRKTTSAGHGIYPLTVFIGNTETRLRTTGTFACIGCYIAEASELPGCMAHGNSYETALQKLKDAIQLWIDTANACGDPTPEPKIHGLPHA